jgi:hypothetical protein
MNALREQVSFEQLEHQRKNPHLYTTLTQSVDVMGNIITLEKVTSKITEVLNKLQEYHYNRYGEKDCNVLCMYQNDDLCEMIRLQQAEYNRAAQSFVTHYHNMNNRR